MGSCHEIVSHRFVPKRTRERRDRKNRALSKEELVSPPPRIFPNRPVTHVAWNARTKCHTPLTYLSRTYLCMYAAHRSLWGTLSPSLPSSQLSPPSLRPRCDTKQQFKFPSSVEIVRHVTSRINTLKGRHIN